MAGDWIKMRTNLWDDPRVARICDLTDQGEAAVIGALYWLWSAADEHTETGIMVGLSVRQIDRKTGVSGFGQALVDIGWIADHPEGIRIVNFEEHNGTSAKRRSTEARRKSESRKGEPPKRKYVSAKQKERIFEADGHKCVYCGRHKDDGTPFNEDPSYYALSVDHLVPVSQGGDNSDMNMVTACMSCNMKKNGRAPEECGMVPDLSERKRTGFGQVSPESGHHAELELEVDLELEKNKKIPPKPPRGNRQPKTLNVTVDHMMLTCSGLSEQLAGEYLAFRKSLKAPLTESAWKNIAAEIEKSSASPDDALSEAMAAGWRSFKAQWLENRNTGGKPQAGSNHGPRKELRLD